MAFPKTNVRVGQIRVRPKRQRTAGQLPRIFAGLRQDRHAAGLQLGDRPGRAHHTPQTTIGQPMGDDHLRQVFSQADLHGFLHAGFGFHILRNKPSIFHGVHFNGVVIRLVGAAGNLRRVPQAMPAMKVIHTRPRAIGDKIG